MPEPKSFFSQIIGCVGYFFDLGAHEKTLPGTLRFIVPWDSPPIVLRQQKILDDHQARAEMEEAKQKTQSKREASGWQGAPQSEADGVYLWKPFRFRFIRIPIISYVGSIWALFSHD